MNLYRKDVNANLRKFLFGAVKTLWMPKTYLSIAYGATIKYLQIHFASSPRTDQNQLYVVEYNLLNYKELRPFFDNKGSRR